MNENTIMMLQPTINIGTIGHVAHGKSTLTRILTNTATGKFKEEIERNMTIKLGYANFKTWGHLDSTCTFLTTSKSSTMSQCCTKCGKNCDLIQHISIVDSPGHSDLLGTMLSGASIMDMAMLVVSASEKCPCPQTVEHFIAADEYSLTKNMIIVQNKIDLCTKDDIYQNKRDIDAFINGTDAMNAPIIPISAQFQVGLQPLLQLLSNLKQPIRDLKSSPVLNIIRSFDINKPGTTPSKIVGGILGGTLLKGQIDCGMEIEIRPGIIYSDKTYTPLYSKINSIQSETNNLLSAIPGGLIALSTDIDPYFTHSDSLVGHVIGIKNEFNQPVFSGITISFRLLKGCKLDTSQPITLCIGSKKCSGKLSNTTKKTTDIVLNTLVCTNTGSSLALFQKNKFIGIGTITTGVQANLHTAQSTQVTFTIDEAKTNDNCETHDNDETKNEQPIPDIYECADLPNIIIEQETKCNRLYRKKCPEPEDLVLCKIEVVQSMIGITASLVEYNKSLFNPNEDKSDEDKSVEEDKLIKNLLVGWINASQFTHKFTVDRTQVGTTEVCRVITVNKKPNSTYDIDLSRKHVKIDEKTSFLKNYTCSKNLRRLIPEDEYPILGFSLYDCSFKKHPLKTLYRICMSDELLSSVFTRLKMIDNRVTINMFQALIDKIKVRVKNIYTTARSIITLHTITTISRLVPILQSDLCRITYLRASEYLIDVTTSDDSLTIIQKCCDKIKNECDKHGVYMSFVEEPHIIQSDEMD